jgi:dUTP pyrophosphatase
MIERALAISSENNNSYIKFVKLTEHALTPTRKSPRSADFDLQSPYDTTVPARGKELIRTDLQIKLPGGCYGRIAPRTDLALDHHIDIGAGVIDQDFRGNLCVTIQSL